MKNHAQNMPVILSLFSILYIQPATTLAQGTPFTYQGRLNDGNTPANGNYDLRFTVYDSLGGGLIAGGPLTNAPTGVSNGLFTVTLDPGAGVFTGPARWVEIGVRTNGSVTAYQTLSPRQPLTATPYAVTAGSVTGVIPAGSLSGSYPGAVTFNNGANVFDGTFNGNGSGLTSLNASQLTSGTVPAAVLGNAWQIGGNSGTSPGNGNFLGTADFQPLELRAGGMRALRLEPDPRVPAEAGNLIGGFTNNLIQQPGSGGNVIAGGGYDAGVNVIHTNSNGVFIGAGSANQIGPNVNDSVIVGGYGNTIQEFDGFIGGGTSDTIQVAADHSVIGGGYKNTIQTNAYHSTIGGGYENTIQSPDSVIVGGASGTIYGNAHYSMIGGGLLNQIYGDTNDYGASVIGGGYAETINSNSWNSVIGGGSENTIGADSWNSFIGGGVENIIGTSSDHAVIAGGYDNMIQNNAVYATIPGGYFNIAAGSNSFAAGTEAQALHAGAFVWADNESAPFASSTTNQFSVRANGGVQFVTGGAGMTLDGQGVVPSGNYIFAYSSSAQTVAAANVFQDITFSTDAQINGWMHTPGASQYTNAQAGLYLVQYSVQASSTTVSGTNVQAQATLNSVAIAGSRSAVSFNALTQIGGVSRSIIASVNNSDVLTIQFTGSSTSVRLSGSPGVALTIVRIQ